MTTWVLIALAILTYTIIMFLIDESRDGDDNDLKPEA